MNIEKITDNILYTGVNDRTTARFEAMWPLPYGVSYNSYIVKGKSKCALIDTVDIKECRSLVEHVSEAVPGGCLNFLVVNHTEPDHSGSIPVLAEIYPQMQIVCNKISAEQIKGFYHIDESRLLVIKDGDAIDLGGLTLRFVTVPMVHWPETMVTYCEEEQVLFSGDAFGCYGALNGSIIDDNIDAADMAAYFSEMRRYYANIVAKYGKFVQAAMKKASGLAIKYVCSTHGPVWHSRIAEVMEVYDRMSRWQSDEGIALVFSTMYGNTSELVDRICTALSRRGLKNIRVHNAATAELSDMITDCVCKDTIIVGSPTYSGDVFPPVDALVKALEIREIKEKTVGVFGSYTWANSALGKLTAAFTRMGCDPAATLAMKQAYSNAMEADVETFADTLAEAVNQRRNG